jgi:hypothetical protein
MYDRGVKYKGIQVDLVNTFKRWMQLKWSPLQLTFRYRLKDYLKNNFFKTNQSSSSDEEFTLCVG